MEATVSAQTLCPWLLTNAVPEALSDSFQSLGTHVAL